MISDNHLNKEVTKLLNIFYTKRIENLNNLDLLKVIGRKNPYLFRSTGVLTPEDVVEGILSAYISSSDETIFGNMFVEPLAIFLAENSFADKKKKAHKSSSGGIDIDIIDDSGHALVAVKSGPNSFNSQSKSRQKAEFASARKRLAGTGTSVSAVIGYSYGTKESNNGEIIEKSGQSFWEYITGDPRMHVRIIDQMGSALQDHDDQFRIAYDRAKINLTQQFIVHFTDKNGAVDWRSLLSFSSEPLAGLGDTAKSFGINNTKLRSIINEHDIPHFGTQKLPKFSIGQIDLIAEAIGSSEDLIN